MKEIVLALAAFTCLFSQKVTEPQKGTLSAEEFRTAISTDTLATIVDVRHQQEYGEGHIKGAILLDVKDEEVFNDSIRHLDKSKTYYIYCRSGRRSATAHELMNKAGLKVKELNGGIMNWAENKFPISKE